MKRILLVLLSIAIFNVALMPSLSAAALVEKDDFEKYFKGFTTSTFIMYDEVNDQYTVFNEPQSISRLSPCSTFKIYNSIAGLETGVLDQEDVSTLFKWNGTQYTFPAWNHAKHWRPLQEIRLSGISKSLHLGLELNGCRHILIRLSMATAIFLTD